MNVRIIKHGLGLFWAESAAVAVTTLAFSFAGHTLRPTLVTGFSTIGGFAGIFIGAILCARWMDVSAEKAFLAALATTGTWNLVVICGLGLLHYPGLLLIAAATVPLINTASILYLESSHAAVRPLWAAVTGAWLLLPLCYFMMSSLLAFQLGHPAMFAPIRMLLDTPGGAAGFNQVTPLAFLTGPLLCLSANGFTLLRFGSSPLVTANRWLIHASVSLLCLLGAYLVAEHLIYH